MCARLAPGEGGGSHKRWEGWDEQSLLVLDTEDGCLSHQKLSPRVCLCYLCTAAWVLALSRYTVFHGREHLGRKQGGSVDRDRRRGSWWEAMEAAEALPVICTSDEVVLWCGADGQVES